MLYISRSLIVLPEFIDMLYGIFVFILTIYTHYHVFIVWWACQKLLRAGDVTQME